MSKPINIALVRHGESHANVDKSLYSKIPDYAVQLTEKGIEQAKNVGVNLRGLMGEKPPQFYVSPFWRTRETYINIAKAGWPMQPVKTNYYEDPRLREQEWHGKLPIDGYQIEAEDERDAYGTFYYRFDGGESVADVYDRVSDFLNTLHRDFEKPNFPENCIIVSHGMAIRVFLMRFFHMTVEDFEMLKNPLNCEMFLLSLNSKNKYELISDLRKHEVKHNYQFKWPE